MSDPGASPDVHPVGPTEAGKACPHCAELLASGEACVACPSCLSPQHAGCWSRAGRCASYFCDAETRRPVEELGAAGIVITREETDRPPPSPEPLPSRPPPAPVPVRVDPCATISLALSALSVVVFFVAPLGALLGAVSLGRIGASGQLRGRGRAAGGFALGVVATLGWAAGGIWLLESGAPDRSYAPFLTREEMPRPPEDGDLAGVPAPIRNAMRANVFIEGRAGGSRWVGSGVIVRATPSHVRILTNRHVADGRGLGATELEVQTVEGERAEATVLWRSDRLDAALLEAPLRDASARVTVARAAPGSPLPAIGSRVFAIGNPHSLSWSYTEGAVSSLRRRSAPRDPLVLIQTQTPINPGNSGGGLYDAEGHLVGLNTWKFERSVGEGLGFAIAVESLLEERSDLVQTAAAGAGEGRGR